MSRSSTDSCCSSSGRATPRKTKPAHRGAQSHSHNHGQTHGHDHGHDRGYGHGCCDGGPSANPKSPQDDCCGHESPPGFSSHLEKCGDGCCDGESPAASEDKVFNNTTSDSDIEKGRPDWEHIIFSVSGMTCTGCETKMKKTLGSLQQVKNLKTSLILSRAEFDLDPAAGSLDDVMKHMNRASEFKCERVLSQGSGIDIVVPSDAAGFSEQPWPDGVTDVTALDKRTVTVAYDSKIIGARDLLEKGWDGPLQLAPPRADPTLEAGFRHVRHLGYMTLLSIALTIPVLALAWGSFPERELAYGGASLALATIVQFVVAGPFYPKALKSLVFSRVVEMDLLIVLSTSAAYIFSVVSFGYLAAGQPLSTGQFFETSTLLVTLIMLGRWVAALARHKAVESISIRSLQMTTATLVDQARNTEREIDTRLLQYGDVFKVAPDSRVPTDGTVISGSSEVDESMITGESLPVEKRTKSTVIAGTINGSGTLLVRLSRLPADNTITAIAGLVDEAKLTKPKIQGLADRVASYFVPVVVTIMLLTFASWVAVGIKVQGQPGSLAAIQAVTYAITVLIVSCPCAIGLAVPMVIVIGTGVAAKHGVIFKSAESIEIAHKASHVVFDKTGTLTEGKLSVVQEEYVSDHNPNTSASLLLGLVDGIKHPVSVAVATHLKAKGVPSLLVSEVKTLTGKGVEGVTPSGQVVRAGNSRWLGCHDDPLVKTILGHARSAFCFTIDGSLAVVIGLTDSVRGDALSTVTELQRREITVHLVSGDDDSVVRSLARSLAILDTNVRSGCTPAEKQTYIRDLLASAKTPRTWGRKPASPVVIFCGDGTNDAVALAQATVGVAVQHADNNKGIGADVAKSAADVILVTPRLSGILTLIAVSKKSVDRIWLNFAWSFVYNLFAILLGAGAFAALNGVRIPPEFAGLGEIVSVLPVVAAALQLRWEKV